MPELWGSEVITQRLSSMLYSTNAIQIRIAQQGDFRAIAELHAASWRSTYCGILSNEYLDRNVGSERIDLWEKRFRNPKASQHILIAEIQADIVGFACAYGNEDEQWGTMLDNLHVLPTQKGKGIGSKLIADVALWCSKAHPAKECFFGLSTGMCRPGDSMSGSAEWLPGKRFGALQMVPRSTNFVMY